MIRLTFPGLVVLGLGLTVAGCSTDFALTPTTPTPTAITEPLFTGTVSPNGSVTQPFSVAEAGSVELLINRLSDSSGDAAVGLDGTIRVGLGLGTWNGQACYLGVPTLTNDSVYVSTVITGYASAAGQLCVRIYDTGDGLGNPKLSEPVGFEIRITHF